MEVVLGNLPLATEPVIVATNEKNLKKPLKPLKL